MPYSTSDSRGAMLSKQGTREVDLRETFGEDVVKLIEQWMSLPESAADTSTASNRTSARPRSEMSTGLHDNHKRHRLPVLEYGADDLVQLSGFQVGLVTQLETTWVVMTDFPHPIEFRKLPEKALAQVSGGGIGPRLVR